MNKMGKGISKSQALKEEKNDIYGFLRVLKTRFWNISALNMLYIIVNFPIFFGLIYLSGVFFAETTAPASPFYPQLLGMVQYGDTPYLSMLTSVIGENVVLSVPTTIANVFGGLTLLIILTNGISSVGASYVTRSFVRGEPTFLFSDFFSAVKKNFKQGLILGVLDALFLFILGYGTMTYFVNSGAYVVNVMLFAEILLFLIYLTMRFYMYTLLITFDLSIVKILKNSFIFAVVGFKRNIVAWIGVILVLFVNIYLLFTIPMLGVIMPFLITPGILMFICGFSSYPVIKKYMIDPYYKKEGLEKITSVDEPIFTDRG